MSQGRSQHPGKVTLHVGDVETEKQRCHVINGRAIYPIVRKRQINMLFLDKHVCVAVASVVNELAGHAWKSRETPSSNSGCCCAAAAY